MTLGPIFWLLIAGIPPSPAPQINPEPPPILTQNLKQWTFDAGTEGWVAEHNCRLAAGGGLLKVRATGEDPHMHVRLEVPGGRLAVQFRARSTTGPNGSVYWMTRQSPRRGEDKAKHFALDGDGQWHEYTVPLDVRGTLVDLRLDPGTGPGQFECDWIRVVRYEPHPLAIERIEVLPAAVRFTVRNQGNRPLSFSAAGRTWDAPAGETVLVEQPLPRREPLEVVRLELASESLPVVKRTVMVHQEQVDTPSLVRSAGPFQLRVARNGTLVRLMRGDQLVAIFAPLVHRAGRIPKLQLVEEEPAIRFQGDGVTLRLEVSENLVHVRIDSPQVCEGPVVRVFGGIQQGLLAGLEYLGRGERSSSTLDVETEDHLRFAPDPLKVTMPLAAVVTDRASVALTWDDMELQPVFAVPNFFDAAEDHRMALRGRRIEATVRLAGDSLEEAVAWAVQRKGLPPVPPAPRTAEEQRKLCLAALQGPLKTDEGWGHCVEDRWPRRWYADMASTLWRLTGRVPDLPELVPHGAHIRNDTIYFVTGQADRWLKTQRAQVRQRIVQQHPDGSYRYAGRYRRGHFEDTASGVCARPAAMLLEFAWITGDAEALAAGLRTLEYMKRFRTPRGAQVWEVPLHTPDLLASAYLVWAYVRGYQLTEKAEYLHHARRWALSGVPFVYLWGRYPVMLYGTPPVYGATNWRAPSWFGLPVQWVGIVYAYALTMLAPYDQTLDWNQLARGILVAGQQMQYPDGPYAGLLPDSFTLAGQRRLPPRINPCALVSLAMAVDGQVSFLDVATDGRHRVAAPFPLQLENGRAIVDARAGLRYQLLVDGERIIDVLSQGRDVIELAGQ
ncbi:MAG TPA: hypothetical protein EYH34_04820 [Planctomycetes bacterium]|nr:hypothetical protein [Planctomycetota bacterium]